MKIDPTTVTIERAPKLEAKSMAPFYVAGRKIVMVAGEPYAEVHMESHGPNGNSFWFKQIGGEPISEPGNKRGATLTVYGDKIEQRRLDHGFYNRKSQPARAEPVEKRLHAKAVELVEAGLIVSAKVQAERVAERRRKIDEATKKGADEKRARFRDRARIALGIPCGCESVGTNQRSIDAVIEAMEWAQSQ